MSVENGIGASVRRKEDQRFITGNGHYLDDMNRVGQAYGYFLRSPHAFAKIKNIDLSAAKAAPGVVDNVDAFVLLRPIVHDHDSGFALSDRIGQRIPRDVHV